jgi:hypothetical protein
MSYYVTLPSNGSDLTSEYGKIYNTQSDFEIDLKDALSFPYKKYEVALSEITFKRNWIFNLGDFHLQDELGLLIDKEISVVDGIPIKKALALINVELNKFEKRKKIIKNGGFELDTTPIIFELDLGGELSLQLPDGFVLSIKGFFASYLRNLIIFDEINQSGNIIQNGDTVILLGHDIAKFKFDFYNHKIFGIENIFVYTNIIDDVHVGSKMVKLLRVIPVKGEIDETISITYDIPHYLSLETNLIERIRMMARDFQGNNIKFNNVHSAIIYKLHFRKKLY